MPCTRPAPALRLVIALLLALPASRALCSADASVSPAQIDAAPCLAAIAVGDDDKIMSSCAEVIDGEKTSKPDRIEALIARGGVYARQDQADRAIADYDAALVLDPTRADVLNARGELWRKKGDRTKALQDFDAALKFDPDHAAARANHKAMARELERIGAQMAVAGKPSFNCARARRAVEKAICADPELADLDREIYAANARVLREAAAEGPHTLRALQREQDEFIARRNAEFGRPTYDLKQAMRERLQRLNGADGHAH